MEEKFCPCCGRHCSLDSPNCGRGVEFAQTGVIPNGSSHHEGRREDKRRERKQHYLTLDIDSKLVYNIRNLGHTVRSMSDGKAGQSRILTILAECESITQSDLTERLDVKPGSVSEVIGKLEKAGLIERVVNEKDRRTCELRLTEEGVTKSVQISAERKSRYEEMFTCLTESEKAELLALLEKISDEWERRYSNKHGHHHDGHHHDKHRDGHHGDHAERRHSED